MSFTSRTCLSSMPPIPGLTSHPTVTCNLLHVLFEDKRLSASLLMVWLSVVLYTFSHLGLFNTQFMSLGPSEKTFFMGVQLETWPKWALVALFTFISTSINDFVGDSLVPFITNTIQDHKNHYLPYSKFTCWLITQTLGVYSCTMSIFSIYLLLSQLDFMLIRMFADSLVNMYTMHRFMKHKKVSKAKYEKHNKRSDIEAGSDDDEEDDDDGDGGNGSNGKAKKDSQTSTNRETSPMSTVGNELGFRRYHEQKDDPEAGYGDSIHSDKYNDKYNSKYSNDHTDTHESGYSDCNDSDEYNRQGSETCSEPPIGSEVRIKPKRRGSTHRLRRLREYGLRLSENSIIKKMCYNNMVAASKRNLVNTNRDPAKKIDTVNYEDCMETLMSVRSDASIDPDASRNQRAAD